MPSVQTTYAATHAIALEGMEADTESSGRRNLSRTVESAAVGFGKAVSQGTVDHGIVAFASATTKFLGVTVRDQAVDPASQNQFRVGDTAPVKTEGAVWVLAGEAITAGDPVYLTSAGAFMKTATSNTLVARARFDTTAASGALVLLRLQ